MRRLFPFLFLLVFVAAPSFRQVASFRTSLQADDPTSTPGPDAVNPPAGAFVEVTYDAQINVRTGPNSYAYQAVGALSPGETAPAIGRSPGGWWIQIRYPGAASGVGWVFATNVKLVSAQPLPIVQPPPTPTQQATATINPTVVASFVTPIPFTPIPTYTPSEPLKIPTYTSSVASETAAGPVPIGLIILLLSLIGGLGVILSFLRGR